MSKLTLVIIPVAILSCVALLIVRGGVQQRPAVYGPVVSAYLTGLIEELNELEYQLRHREISRSDYDRAKQRLTILRRFVERLATQSREDVVPELQVLADDELASLGLNTKLEPDKLQVGDLFDGQWKLVGIERPRMRLFIFKRLSSLEAAPSETVVPERKADRKIDPREIVETIIVRERPSPPSLPQSQSNSNDAPHVTVQTEKTLPAGRNNNAEEQQRIQPPRLVHIFLPQYTDKARNNGVVGEIVVRGLFQSDGRIKNVKIEKSLGYGLDERAIDSVKRIGFIPARIDGKDVDAFAQIIFNFKFGKVTFYLKVEEPSVSKQARP